MAQTFNTQKSWAIITGATSGIGKATADILLQNNYGVILTGRRLQRLKDIQKSYQDIQLGDSCAIMNFDISSPQSIDEAFQKFESEHPNFLSTVNILINNAGVAKGLNPFQSVSREDANTMFQTNVLGLMDVTKKMIPHFMAKQNGMIINVSSIAGLENYPNGNVYCATKHAVESLTKSLRLVLYTHGIKVSSIAPGMVETEFSIQRFSGDVEKAKNVYAGMIPLKASDIAEGIYFMISRPDHVLIADMTIFPKHQGSATHVRRI